MALIYCWDVDCQTDGIVTVWGETAPTECPNAGGHIVDGIGPTAGPYNNGQPRADGELYLNDGAGRVFKLTVDQNGDLSTAQVAGDPPA